jgi:Zn-dependent oligopeptidase
LRWQIFRTGYSAPKENLALLEQLVDVRREMTELMGAQSYAHYALGGGSTLAGSPEAVDSFLQGLAAAIRPKAGALIQMHGDAEYNWSGAHWPGHLG